MLAAFSLALAAFAGCSLLNPLSEFEAGRSAVPTSDAADAGADVFDGYTCDPVRWPSRPQQGQEPAGDLTLVQAAQTFEFTPTPSDSGLPVAFDLDGVCTCPGPDSCKRPAGAKPACDTPGGIDNGGGDVLLTLARIAGVQLDVNDRIAAGDYGLLFRIKGYNGLANDSQVVVEMFFSFGTNGAQDGGVSTRPRFDGTDVWTVDPDSVVGTDPTKYISQYFDTDAYVADDTVVAHLENAPIRMGPIVERVRGGVVVAKLVRDGAGIRIVDGRLLGRFRAAEFLTTLDVIPDRTTDGGGVCGDASSVYQLITPLVCSGADLVADPLLDGKGEACDAVAFTARFSARPAILGDPFKGPTRPRLCGTGWAAACP